ncbi:MAG: hypothetical protein EP329_04555 [Deltaproteobacteria bacterium]|nr:MAG: hypothetical protein EP329_04555 [Deltaproteobacteria bacterium]
MPTLIVQTNRELTRSEEADAARHGSRVVATLVDKDERWVMVSVRGGVTMTYGGSDAPCAYLELKSLGLAVEACEAVAEGLCVFVEQALGVPRDRVYVEMSAPDPRRFGWDGGTFG